ncbi:hypothetical protein M2281_004811 [Mesorhizobium soli]|jgi:hypothetical protein|uniref:hypothetical protein n=1 Tax=Pseudaminobacter soli (ex Li et al. 2025) TaxID=1295366 RepID=UPI0024768CE8|nr:hypothetical protein [Mesorhizobium soli]MDH6234197.1 hypothetical protein [Mesorhizobium soli]
MFSFVRNATLSALLCLGGVAAALQPAAAQSVQFEIGPSGSRVVVEPDCRRDRHDPRCRRDWRSNDDEGYDGDYRGDYRGERRDDRRDRRDRYGRDCSPEQALDKADRMGIRRARIETVGRRFVEVSGRSGGRWVSVTFARERGCPILRR